MVNLSLCFCGLDPCLEYYERILANSWFSFTLVIPSLEWRKCICVSLLFLTAYMLLHFHDPAAFKFHIFGRVYLVIRPQIT